MKMMIGAVVHWMCGPLEGLPSTKWPVWYCFRSKIFNAGARVGKIK